MPEQPRFNPNALPWKVSAVEGGSGGGVSEVTATSPLHSSGGSTPDITLSDVIPIELGGTNSSTPLSNNRAMVSSGDAIIESNASTSSQVFVGGTPPAFGPLPAAAIPNTTVVAGSYPTAGQLSTFTVGADGRLTAAGSSTNGSSLTNLDAGNITAGTLAIARGGTNSSSPLVNNRAMVSSSGAIIESNASNSNQVLVGGTPPAFDALPAAAIPNTTVVAGSYPTAGQLSTFTVGADGRLTAAGSSTNGSSLTSLNAGNITAGTLAVARGGTGAGTLTTHGVIVGNGTNPVSVTSAGTAGQVFTSGGPGADPSFQDPITAASSSLTAAFTDLVADDTWTDVLNLTAPLAPGLYLLQADLVSLVNVSAGQGFIQVRLFNQTDAVEVADSLRTCVAASVVGADYSQTTSMNKLLQIVGGTKTIKVQAQRVSGGTYATSFINSDLVLGFSVLNILRLNYQ